jgi:DNA-binding NarL/FixJ family response regulator
MPNFTGCTATSPSIEFAIETRPFTYPCPSEFLSLIADDDSSVRRAIRTFIEHRSQFEVCEAANGNEALQQAAALNPDLIVLDLSMPTANGVEVAALLHSRMPPTPVVIYTMYGDLVRGSMAKILGIAALVPKSDGVAELLRRIGRRGRIGGY